MGKWLGAAFRGRPIAVTRRPDEDRSRSRRSSLGARSHKQADLALCRARRPDRTPRKTLRRNQMADTQHSAWQVERIRRGQERECLRTKEHEVSRLYASATSEKREARSLKTKHRS